MRLSKAIHPLAHYLHASCCRHYGTQRHSPSGFRCRLGPPRAVRGSCSMHNPKGGFLVADDMIIAVAIQWWEAGTNKTRERLAAIVEHYSQVYAVTDPQ